MFEFIEVKYKNIVDISHLHIGQGLTAILGSSGGGKTTVLRMLNKMISPTQGQILYNGQDLKQIKSVEHRRRVMMLSQNPTMFEGTVKDNLTIAIRLQEKQIPGDEELYRVLKRVHLNKDLEAPAYQLSGGEKQRIALARLILCDPAVYLLDEPSAALDEATEDAIINMVAEHIETEHKSAIMVTHATSLAEKYAREIIPMSDGKVINRSIVHESDN